MEFHEKLQELRKSRGLTQEELAAALYVSRAAVSKWESGRGYPSIDSLKQLSDFFTVSIDSLLSSREALSIAEEDHKQKRTQLLDLIFGLMDLSVLLFCILPLFGQPSGDAVLAVSLFALTEISAYLKGLYCAAMGITLLVGLATLALQHSFVALWARCKRAVSLLCSALGVLVFIVSSQPYAATILFLFLIFKGLLLKNMG